MIIEDVIDFIMSELIDLKPRIYHKSGHSTFYISFRNPNLRKVRVSSHESDKIYKWNIIRGYGENRIIEGNYYYSWEELDDFIHKFRKLHAGMRK